MYVTIVENHTSTSIFVVVSKFTFVRDPLHAYLYGVNERWCVMVADLVLGPQYNVGQGKESPCGL
jgi:hypothetical protein